MSALESHAADALKSFEEIAMNMVAQQEITDFDVAEVEHGPIVRVPQKTVVSATPTPADLVRHAMDSGADLDRLERLMDMQMKWEANEARKAYHLAMADFKRNPPTIYKDKHVEFRTDKGVTAYDHATLGNVVERVVAALAEHGFSHRWVPNRGEGGLISITCVITHKLGHSEETTLEAGLDQSGGKNNIQAMISTKSYLERHSLLAAVGLATRDTPGDDGRGAARNDDIDALVEKWKNNVAGAKTEKEVRGLWAQAAPELRATKDTVAFGEVKHLVESKIADFKASDAK
jgi:hypothetical protein